MSFYKDIGIYYIEHYGKDKDYHIIKSLYNNEQDAHKVWVKLTLLGKENLRLYEYEMYLIEKLMSISTIKNKYIISFKNDNLYIKVKQINKPKFKSKIQRYREEVKAKLELGQTDYINTSINLSKRDRNSVLREFGLEIPYEASNLDLLHIQWGEKLNNIFCNALENDWTKARVIRKIHEELGKDIKDSTIYYKHKEFHMRYGCNEYEYYDMFRDYEKIHGRENTLIYFDLNTSERNIYVLMDNYSFSEITYITQLPFYEVYSLVKNNPNSLQQSHFRFINSNLTKDETFYKIDYDNVEYELSNYDNNYFCNKYNIGYSTVGSLRRKFNIKERHDFRADLNKCETKEEMDKCIEGYSNNSWYDYYKEDIEQIKTSILEKRIIEDEHKVKKEKAFMEFKANSYKVRYMYLLGYSIKEIGSELNISDSLVSTILRKVNLDINKFKKLCIEKGYHVCYQCHSIRTLDNFHKIRGTNLYRTQCKDCRRVSKSLIGCTSQDLQNMYKWFNYECAYCGEKLDGNTLNVDHIVPRVKGGSNHISNLTISCGYCNSEVKSDLDLDELEINNKFTRERKDKILKWIELNKC